MNPFTHSESTPLSRLSQFPLVMVEMREGTLRTVVRSDVNDAALYLVASLETLFRNTELTNMPPHARDLQSWVRRPI